MPNQLCVHRSGDGVFRLQTKQHVQRINACTKHKKIQATHLFPAAAAACRLTFCKSLVFWPISLAFLSPSIMLPMLKPPSFFSPPPPSAGFAPPPPKSIAGCTHREEKGVGGWIKERRHKLKQRKKKTEAGSGGGRRLTVNYNKKKNLQNAFSSGFFSACLFKCAGPICATPMKNHFRSSSTSAYAINRVPHGPRCGLRSKNIAKTVAAFHVCLVRDTTLRDLGGSTFALVQSFPTIPLLIRAFSSSYAYSSIKNWSRGGTVSHVTYGILAKQQPATAPDRTRRREKRCPWAPV